MIAPSLRYYGYGHTRRVNNLGGHRTQDETLEISQPSAAQNDLVAVLLSRYFDNCFARFAHPNHDLCSSTAVDMPQVLAVALIAPWDISFDTRLWGPLTEAHRQEAGLAMFEDINGRLNGATARSITGEVMREGANLDLTKFAVPLARRPLLIVTATRDSDDDKATGLIAALGQAHPKDLSVQIMQTDHNFNDRRIALQTTLLRWLSTLPGAPELAASTALPATSPPVL